MHVSLRWINIEACGNNPKPQVRIQRGGGGARGPYPPGKSQVLWVSIGNKQLDPPPPPLEKVGPPWKMLDPL